MKRTAIESPIGLSALHFMTNIFLILVQLPSNKSSYNTHGMYL